MDFALDDEQRMVAETARTFFAEHATSERIRAAIDRDGIDRDLWQAYCDELGFGALLVPESRGGVGLGPVELALVFEAAGRTLAPLPMIGQAAAVAALLAGGDEAGIDQYLSPIMSGERIVAIAEQGLAPHGAVADLLLTFDHADAVLREPGEVVTLRSLDSTAPFARVAAGQGFRLPGAAAEGRHVALLCLAALATGGAGEALDRTVAFGLERHQFARPVGSFQAYKHRLADRAVDVEQARSALWWAAASLAEQAPDTDLALHAAKCFCGDTFLACAGDMIQLHGGIGFTWEHDAHLFFKRARSLSTQLGNGPHHREQIARMILDDAA